MNSSPKVDQYPQDEEIKLVEGTPEVIEEIHDLLHKAQHKTCVLGYDCCLALKDLIHEIHQLIEIDYPYSRFS